MFSIYLHFGKFSHPKNFSRCALLFCCSQYQLATALWTNSVSPRRFRRFGISRADISGRRIFCGRCGNPDVVFHLFYLCYVHSFLLAGNLSQRIKPVEDIVYLLRREHDFRFLTLAATSATASFLCITNRSREVSFISIKRHLSLNTM